MSSLTESEVMDGAEAARAPTWSAEAEQAVLGALLVDNAAWDRVGDTLTESDFYDRRHGLIFGAIGALVNACKPADVVSVFETLRDSGRHDDCGGLVYLNALMQSVISASGARRHAAIVRERSVQRELLAAAGQAVELAAKAGSVEEKLDAIVTLFGTMQRKTVRRLPRQLADIAIRRTEHYEALERGEVQPGWRTHIPRLTAMLNGGFRAGGLYILAARPSVGKSSLAEDLGLNLAADDLPTLFLSQEMPDTEVADRAVSSSGSVDFTSMLTGKLNSDGWARACEALERIAQRPFWVDDQPSLTLHDVRAKARSVPGLKVLILDYLQLCASTRKDGNRNSEIEEISRGLKALAKEMGIAVLALSQLNRDVEKRANRRPNLGDLRDSGAIEQDADVVLFLWPVREDKDTGIKTIGCGIDKNRQGRTGEFALEFHGATQQWRESSEPLPKPGEKKGFE